MTTEQEKEWARLRDLHYGTPFVAEFAGGVVDFSPSGFKTLESAPRYMTYDDYLAAQLRSIGSQRKLIGKCFFDGRRVHAEGTVSFSYWNRTLVADLLVSDGDDKEQESHVWIYKNSVRRKKDARAFSRLVQDEKVSFDAEPYRYYRKDGTIDFGLRNPSHIRNIKSARQK